MWKKEKGENNFFMVRWLFTEQKNEWVDIALIELGTVKVEVTQATPAIFVSQTRFLKKWLYASFSSVQMFPF